jgi:hypothetical protein
MNNAVSSSGGIPLLGRSSTPSIRPPSPPILGISNTNNIQNLPLNTANPQVIYKPNNQEVVYKQNIMVRWLQPPTPPPLAPIIIRGKFYIFLLEINSILIIEVQVPASKEPQQPPLICRQIPPCPPTPPPIIVR